MTTAATSVLGRLQAGDAELGSLPPKADRSGEQRDRAASLLAEGRELRTAFLAEHAERVYEELTDGCRKPVRVEELVFLGAESHPGLLPAREAMAGQRRLPLAEKEGLEIAQGLFLSAVLALPRAGAHLLHSMLRPRSEALARLDAYLETGRADLGLAAVAVSDLLQAGDPLGFAHAQASWVGPHRNPLYPIGTIGTAILTADAFRPESLGLPVLLASGAAVFWCARRLPAGYTAYAGAMVLLAARQGLYLNSFFSVPRYLVVIFPCYFAFAAGLAGRRNLQAAVLVLLAGVLLVESALYASWRFIG